MLRIISFINLCWASTIYTFFYLKKKWDFHVLFLGSQNAAAGLPFPTRVFLSSLLPSCVLLIFVLAVLCTKGSLLVAFTWSCIESSSSSFSPELAPVAALLEGDRRKQRSPKSSGMPWPMRKPGFWRRSGKWRWRTARLLKSWRNGYMRNSRWVSA